MSTFRIYQTRQGDRWDTIAFAQYSDPFGYERIVSANPEHAQRLVLPGGVRLKIPVVQNLAPTIPTASLPPWKR